MMNAVLKNMLMSEREKAEGAVQLESLPNIIGVPTGTLCNYKCIFCKDIISSGKLEQRNITFEEFKMFADVIRHPKNIGLFSWGEPLLNRDYMKMLRYVSRNNPDSFISLSTNGSLMDDRIIDIFVQHGLVNVSVSINAPNETLYRKITGTKLFYRVKRNIAELTQRANVKLFARIKVILSLVLIPDVIEVLPSFVDLARETGCDEILIQNYEDFGSFHKSLSIDMQPELHQVANSKYQEAKEKAFSVGVHLRVFTPISYIDEDFSYECWEPWERFWINLNGDVHVCCYSRQVMGNVLKSDLEAIWNNGLYRYYRSKVNTDHPPDDCLICPRRKNIKRSS